MALIQGDGKDNTLVGTPNRDCISGFAGNDSLLGRGGNDRINGGLGNDLLDGGTGRDSLRGGAGNDTYIVDSTGDIIMEASNSGTDRVRSSVSYTLGSNLENLTLLGTSAINGTGNSLDNIIIGNAGNNSLRGGAGNDTLEAVFSGEPYSAQEDILYGGDGDDRLEGDSYGGNYSTNKLYGGNGNDNLYGGNYTTNRLYGGNGNDTLFSGNSYSADRLYGGNGNDNLYGGLNGGGILYGGDGNDTLDAGIYDGSTLYGGNGNDTLRGNYDYDSTLNGGTGNDTYFSSAGDTIIEATNAGIDTVQYSGSYTLASNLENLTLVGGTNGTGNSLNNVIVGNAINNTLKGQAGNDTLRGSSGSVGEIDILTGGTGRDTFALGNVIQAFYDDDNSATAGKNDYALITDFSNSQDVILLNGKKTDYVLKLFSSGVPAGTAIYLNKSGSEPDELIGIIQGSSGLSLDNNYFRFISAEVSLANLDGSDGFVLNGVDEDDESGASVSNAGDVNGDGFDDLIVGAPDAGPYDDFNPGESYVVFGQAERFDPSLDLADLDGSNGFVLKAIEKDDRLGNSVSNAGDVNGDGFSDLIIGAFHAGPADSYSSSNIAGESYVVFGQAERFDPSLDLADLNGSNGFVIRGIRTGDVSGTAVSTAGDLNGDGFDDLIVGAPQTNSTLVRTGESYVVFGKAEGFDPSLDLADLDGSNGFVIRGIDEDDDLGTSVSNAGDVNGDGLDDLILGAPGAGPRGTYGNNARGESYVVFSKAEGFGRSLNLADLGGSNGFVIDGVDARDRSGFSVSSAGDINGDGLGDLIIGAPRNYSSSLRLSQSYLVFGRPGGFDSSLKLADLDGSNGFVISGIDPYDYSGTSVSSAGDINSDGLDDLIIGAPSADPGDPNGQDRAGESYVVFGKAGGFGASFSLADLDDRNGFVISGIDPYDYSGTSVSTAGDVNGDGFDDLVIGAPASGYGGRAAGQSYTVFGRDFTGQVNRPGTAGNDVLTGTSGEDILIGGLGDDRLIGGRGSDVLKGGSGNDLLSFGPIDRRTDGGSGTDTLSIEFSGANLDLTTISNNKITEIEKIDITGIGNNRLKLNRLDVLDLSDTTNRLIVNGNIGDKVVSTGQDWMFGGTTTLEGILYDRYTAGAARLLVDTDITQTIS